MRNHILLTAILAIVSALAVLWKSAQMNPNKRMVIDIVFECVLYVGAITILICLVCMIWGIG